MALFMKQDFNPPILSRRWIALKFRPNMLIHSRENIVLILESGLLFREDSIEVEQEAPAADQVWKAAGGSWMLTKGEKVMAVASVATCLYISPPRSLHQSTFIKLLAYSALPLSLRWYHRRKSRGNLFTLLALMRDYLALARRTQACVKEYNALFAQLGSVITTLQWTDALLCRQQSEISVLLSRASSAVLGNAPWLRDDVAWDALTRERDESLMKIHHAFLVVQSTFLKHLAMIHYIPPQNAQRIYKNHNERLYWVHNTIIPHLIEQYKENMESLERMYRLLKNSTNKDMETKKLGSAFNENWFYSDIHTGVAKSCLELKLALNKSNSLDAFLDSCAINKQEIDLDVLNKDLDEIIDTITKCLKTMQNSQIRLKKLQNKNCKEIDDVQENEIVVENAAILKIDDREPESRDEVFYLLKTEDDVTIQPAEDLITAPGKKEKETKIVVLSELKRKLGKREDAMRERERQALAKTMPGLKEIPEFPRQIDLDEFIEKKGYITKMKKKVLKKKEFRNQIKKLKPKDKKYHLKLAKYDNESDITGEIYEANAKLNVKSKLLTISTKNNYYITKWCKNVASNKKYYDSSSLSDSYNDVKPSTSNRKFNNNKEIRFSKKDLELSPSSSESDFEFYSEKQLSLLNDVRKHRVTRKKNYPNHRRASKDNEGGDTNKNNYTNHRRTSKDNDDTNHRRTPKDNEDPKKHNYPQYRQDIDDEDESLKPIEYSFGTGMAMASVLQVSKKVPNYLCNEEVFIGDGEVSSDSGNDEDA